MWLQDANAWVYPHLHRAAWRMKELAAGHPDARGETQRALTQALRELLLAQSSDWAFMLAEGRTAPYARRRFTEHLAQFTRLYEELRNRTGIDKIRLADLEEKDNLFPFLDGGV